MSPTLSPTDGVTLLAKMPRGAIDLPASLNGAVNEVKGKYRRVATAADTAYAALHLTTAPVFAILSQRHTFTFKSSTTSQEDSHENRPHPTEPIIKRTSRTLIPMPLRRWPPKSETEVFASIRDRPRLSLIFIMRRVGNMWSSCLARWRSKSVTGPGVNSSLAMSWWRRT